MFAIRGGTAGLQQQKRMQNSKQSQAAKAALSFQSNMKPQEKISTHSIKQDETSFFTPLDNSQEKENNINRQILDLLAKLFVIQSEENEKLERKNNFLEKKFKAIGQILTGKENPPPEPDKKNVDIQA